jgi:type VI secretion system protein ImpK
VGALTATSASVAPAVAPDDVRRASSPYARRLALHAAARPLVALAMPLRQTAVAPPALRPALAAAVERFERDLAIGGWDARGIAAASYLICTWLDEVVADTPWGSDGAGLLQRFHGESDGGDRVLRLLSTLAEQPHDNRALLELFHTCLGLGLTGRLRTQPDLARQRDALRRRVFRALGSEAVSPPSLAPAWRSAAPATPPIWRRHAAVGLLLALSLLALGIYM